jgi:hypothetical protein
MGADSFRLGTAMGVDGQLTTSTAALLMSEASWSIKEGDMFARQLSKCSVMHVSGVLWTVRLQSMPAITASISKRAVWGNSSINFNFCDNSVYLKDWHHCNFAVQTM